MDDDVPQTPISPSGSLRGWRPSLVWLFNHVRAEDRDYLTKEDLATILGGSIDSDELDEAFEKLDTDGSGHISIEEFMEGFATFLRDTRHSQAESMRPRSTSFRRRRPVQELFYESENSSQEENKPSFGFKSSLSFLSPQNRESIQKLWQNLNGSDPELINDFEEFISGISAEVQVAQNALSKQREATKQEAIVLDEEIERIQSTAQTKLQQETAVLREQAQSKLETQLHEKEEELGAIRQKLEQMSCLLDACLLSALQLESEVSASKHNQVKLQHKYEESCLEQQQLLERLESSEQMLRESQNTIVALKQNADMEQERQRGMLDDQEEVLFQLRQAYQEEVAEVRLRLQALDQQQQSLQENQQQLLLPTSDITEDSGYDAVPDILPYRDRERIQPSPGSLLDEIIESEGAPYTTSNTDGMSNFKQLAHLDLAMSRPRVPHPSSYPAAMSPSNQPVLRRPHSSRNGRSKAARPVSMFCDEQGWPIIQSAQVPSSEWLSTDPVRVSEPAVSNHPAKDTRASENYLEMCKVIRLFY